MRSKGPPRIFDAGVDFGAGTIPRVTDELPGIHAQIVDRLRLEELPRVAKIAKETLRVGSKRGDRERRIGELAFPFFAQCGL